jgi:signal transduction histidine kinase/ActR/RegA family two-component response regulator
VLEFNAEGALTYFNDAAQALASSLDREHPSAILPAGTADIVKECLERGQNKARYETPVSGRTLAWSFVPVATSQVVHAYVRDATEQLRQEAQIWQAQKMESIGQLAAGVAHDFNNLLSVVQGYSTLLMEDLEKKPATAEALQQITSATERGTHLTRQLLTLGRKQVMQKQTLDLHEVINNASKSVRGAIGESIALQYNYSPGLPAVEADPAMMAQVVLNLSINAGQAMPEGGQLTIGTKVVEVDDASLRHNAEARPGRFVCLSVTDTGAGMDEASLARIFEPFVKTKPGGKGTGLGLATIYGIIQQHQGWIETHSQIGQGTTFTVFLPVSSKAPALPTAESSRPVHRGGTETILLVEDEPSVLMMAKGILQRLGYQVITAPSGDEAVPLWREQSAKIDLLLTDMVMPGSLNGRELAERLQQERPGLKVLYTSGYSMELLGTSLTSSKDFVFLPKPYHPDTLAQTVRDCLDAKTN